MKKAFLALQKVPSRKLDAFDQLVTIPGFSTICHIRATRIYAEQIAAKYGGYVAEIDNLTENELNAFARFHSFATDNPNDIDSAIKQCQNMAIEHYKSKTI